MRTTASTHKDPAYRLGALALLVAAAVILAALAFEYIGGHAPCPLCLTERYAYYVAIPLLFLAMIAVASGHNELAALGFFIVALAFFANMILGGYHTGAEWGFWPGPSTCSGALQPLGSPADLLKGTQIPRVVRCDAASWWFLGLSFAGWNTVVSTVLWITSLQAGRIALAAGSPPKTRFPI